MVDQTENYYDRIHRKAWTRRTAGFLTGATLLGSVGAIGGAVSAYLPYALSAMGIGAAGVAAPGLLAVASTTAVFATVAGFSGMVIASDVGVNAAAHAAHLEELDRRDKLAGKKISSQLTEYKDSSVFNWKVGATLGVLFAAFGALTAFSPVTSTIAVGGLGLETGSSAAVAASAIVMGMFGAVFGLKFSLLSNKISNAYMKLLTGEMFEQRPQKDIPMPQPQAGVERSNETTAITEPQRENTKIFASQHPRFSLQGLIEKNEERSPAQDVVLTR